MTWKEFKEEVEKAGVMDDMRIDFIDVHGDEIEVKIKDDTFSVS